MTDLSLSQKRAVYLAIFLGGVAALAAALACIGWTPVWTALKLPTLSPIFADMRIIQGAAQSAAAGLDPQISNPFDPWQRPMNYPIIWARIAALLHFEDEANFFIFVFGMIAVLIGCLAVIIDRYPSLWIVLAVFSTSTLLLVERGNSDIPVFCLVCLALWVSSAGLGAMLIGGATVLKFFPLFSAGFLLRDKRVFAMLAIAAVIFTGFSAPEMAKVKAIVSVSPIISYGSQSLAEFLKVNAHVTLSPVLILLPHLLGVALLLRCGDRLRILSPAVPGDDRMFLAGAGIYVGSFVLSCNWDYRLIFVILCIPYLTRLADPRIRLAALGSIILSMNYLLLEAYGGFGGILLNLAAKSFLFILLTSLFCHAMRVYGDDIRRLWLRLVPGKGKTA